MGDGLNELAGTRWRGTKQLWLEPDAPPEISDATIVVDDSELRYTWAWKGAPQSGTVAFSRTPAGVEATFTDTWHQPVAMACRGINSRALLAVIGSYPAPPGPDWGWRTLLSQRPSGELVLQMINVTPWGEEHRAVLIVASRDTTAG